MIKYILGISLYLSSGLLFACEDNEKDEHGLCKGNSFHFGIEQDPELSSPNIKVRIIAKFKKLNILNKELTAKFIKINENLIKLDTIIKNSEGTIACGVTAGISRDIYKIEGKMKSIQKLLFDLKSDVTKNDSKEDEISSLEENYILLGEHKKSYVNALSKSNLKVENLNCKTTTK